MKKLTYYLLLTILFFVSTHKSFSQECIDLGTGIDMNNNEYAFIDFFKNGGRWILKDADGHPWYKVNSLDEFKVVRGAYYNWDADWSGTVNNDAWGDKWADCFISYYDMMIDQNLVDENGYPKQVPLTLYKYLPKSVDPNQGIDNSQPVQINEVDQRIYFPEGLPQDGWIMKWEGEGTIEFEGIEVTNSDVPYTVVDSKSWTPDNIYAGQDVRFTSTDGGRVECKHFYMVHGWVLHIKSSNPANPLRNFSFIFPGMEALYDAGQIFQPDYLERISQFNAIRYMGYNNGNGLEARSRVGANNPFYNTHWLSYMSWDERPRDNWYRVNDGDGGSYQYIVELSNLTKTNPWINLPYACGPEYADSVVQYFLRNLDPDLTIYFEIGNEIWNFAGGFTSYRWFAEMKTRHWPGLGDVEARGQQLNKILSAITLSAGDKGLERIERVYGAWKDYESVNNNTLLQIDPKNWDCYATTWYFGLSEDNSGENTCKDPVTGNNYKLALYDWHLAHPNDQSEFNQRYRDAVLAEWRCRGSKRNSSDFQIASFYNKYVVAYEGGNHTFFGCQNAPLGGSLPGEMNTNTPVYPLYKTDNSFINAIAVADESDEMAEVYEELLDTLQSAGMKLANHLAFSDQSDCYGLWSLIQPRDLDESLDTLIARYPKFRVFTQRIASSNCNAVNVVLPENNVGAGLSVKLDGINDYIEGQTIYLPDESSNYTLECWINPYFLSEDQIAVSFSNTGANNNYNVIKIRSDKKIVWEIGNNGTFQVKLVGSALKEKKWNHVAVSKNGNRYTLYLNGYNVASGNYSMLPATRNKYTIGGLFATPNNDFPFIGEIDEIRLWDVARTEAQIREYMCKKVPVSANLRSYYKLDKPDYINYLVYDAATGTNTGILKNITITDRSRYAVSGAAIGDYSAYRYVTNWNGVSLSLTHPQGDMLAVSNLGNGNPNGVQVYFVNGESFYNNPPEFYQGIADDSYLGVFMANGIEPSYDLVYVYSGNPDEKTGAEENMHRLLHRENSGQEDWVHAGAKLDMVANSLSLGCKEKERGEYTMGFRPKLNSVRAGAGRALYNPQPTTGGNGGVARNLHINDYSVTWWSKGVGEIVNFTNPSGVEQRISVSNSLHLRFTPAGGSRQGVDAQADYNVWSHYAVTRKGSLVSFYVNGVLQTTQNLIGSFDITEMELMHDPSYAGGNYPGNAASLRLDELAIWDIALDEATIRDWMCKKITDEHPYECENLILYFNFEENQGTVLEDTRGSSDIVLFSDSGGFEWVASGAAVGDESIHDYISPQDISFAHDNGDYLQATRTTGSNSGVHMYRVNNMAPDPSATDNSAIVSMDSSRYWGIFAANAAGANSEYTLTSFYEDNSNVNLTNESELRLLSREDNAQDPWNANIGIMPNTTVHSLTLTNQKRGEYVLGGTTANTFSFNVPATPIFSTETATLNLSNICGNTSSLVYAVVSDPSVTNYIWEIPTGLDGYSISDSIVLNGAYAGAASTVITISVRAVNQFGESSPATYDITVNPPPTIADAGPDQIILPPSTTALMDGNAGSTGETGTWTIGNIGTATFVNANDPVTTAMGLSPGNNYLAWTIDNGSCQPSTDTVNIMLAPPPQNIVMGNGNSLPGNVCETEILVLKAIPAEDIEPDSYLWKLPDGMSQLSANDDEISILVQNGFGGKIEVRAVYEGSASDAFISGSIGITAQPSKPVFIDSASVFCLNVDINLEVALDATIDSLEWTLPYGIYPVDFPKSTSESILIQAIDPTTGYISVKAFNKGCTNLAAIDSFYFVVDSAPSIPILRLGSNGGSVDSYCKDENLILWVENPDTGIQYEWRWEAGSEFLEYFGENNHGALFNMPGSDKSIWVKAVKGTGVCSSSEEFHFNGWSRSGQYPAAQPTISITNPVGQVPTNLQVGQTYTITVSGTTTDYFWSVPEGVAITDAANKKWDNENEIIVNEVFAGFIEVWAVRLAGCASDRVRLAISTNGMVFPPEYESGVTNICQGNSLNVFVTDVGADEYIWTLPDGTSYTTTTPELNEIINTPMQGMLTFFAKYGSMESTSEEVYIEIKSANISAGTFVDEDNNPMNTLEVCPVADRYDYISIFHTDELASEYIWEIDGTILEFFPQYEPGHEGDANYVLKNRTSLVDTMMQVGYSSWRVIGDGTDGGYIKINLVNACGGANARDSIYYYLSNNMEIVVPEFVNMPTQVCVGSSVSYSVEPIEDASQYIWSLPNGLEADEIVTSVPEITVNVVSGVGGKIQVYATGETCGGGTTQLQTSETISIEGSPLDFNFIDAPMAGCPGEDITYSVNDIGAGTYYWSLPEGLGSTMLDNDNAVSVVINGSWNVMEREDMINGSTLVGANNSVKSVVYTPDLPFTGTYKVSVSYFNDGRNSNSVPITINHANGSNTVIVNMNTLPPNGIWETIGEYDFSAGTGGSVSIETYATGGNNSMADAVKFDIVSIPDDTTITIPVLGTEGGAVCVKVNSSTCPSGYTICTDPINLGGTLESPIFIDEENSVCEGNEYQFRVSDIGADTYTWHLPAGFSIDGQTGVVSGLSRVENVLAESNMGIPVQIGVNGVIASCGVVGDTVYSASVSFNGEDCKLSDPVLVAPVPDTICGNGSLIFSIIPVAGAENYQWQLPAGLAELGSGTTGLVTTTDPSISLVSTGFGVLGSVTVTANAPVAGIQSSNSVATPNPVVVMSPASFTISTSDLTSCTSNDGIIMLNGLSPVSIYDVSYYDGTAVIGPGTFNSNGSGQIMITGLAAGTYTNIEVSAGGCSTIDAGTYTLNTGLPNVTLAEFNDLCVNDTAISLVQGFPAGGSYSGTGISAGKFNPSIAGAGNHTISYTYTEAPGCSNSATAVILVKEIPSGTFNCSDADNTICEGTPVEFTANGGDNYSFKLNGIVVANNTNGIYTIPDVTDGDAIGASVSLNGCIADYEDIVIHVVSLPLGTLTSSHDTICENVEVTFSATGGSNYNFMINGNSMQSSAVSTYAASTLSNGDEISVQITDENACSNILNETISISVISAPASEISGKTDLCPDMRGEIYSATILPNVVYDWEVAGADDFVKITDSQIEVDWSKSTNGNISLTLLDTLTSCVSATELIISLTDNGAPLILCASDDEVDGVFENDHWKYTISDQDYWIPEVIEDCESAGYSLIFTVNDLLVEDEFVGYSLVETENVIEWTATDNLGQSSSCSLTVNMNIKEKIPGAFSPNGDGINDTWEMPFLSLYDNCVVMVFDRNGRKVFESDKGYPDPWDGTFFGRSLSVDSYHFVIQKNNNSKPSTGTITIIK